MVINSRASPSTYLQISVYFCIVLVQMEVHAGGNQRGGGGGGGDEKQLIDLEWPNHSINIITI